LNFAQITGEAIDSEVGEVAVEAAWLVGDGDPGAEDERCALSGTALI